MSRKRRCALCTVMVHSEGCQRKKTAFVTQVMWSCTGYSQSRSWGRDGDVCPSQLYTTCTIPYIWKCWQWVFQYKFLVQPLRHITALCWSVGEQVISVANLLMALGFMVVCALEIAERNRSYECTSFVETQATALLKEFPVEFVKYPCYWIDFGLYKRRAGASKDVCICFK